MPHNFDEIIDRRTSDSAKWHAYGPEVLPMWVADMDFRSPEPVVRALCERAGHGVYGYAQMPTQVIEALCQWLLQRYEWAVTPDQVVLLPGLVTGNNLACRAFGQAGDGVVTQTPIYPPFLSAPGNFGQQLQAAELAPQIDGHRLCYAVDPAGMEAAITARTKLFLLCHPHNPTGMDFSPAELTQLAEVSLRHNLVICSDEIHADLLLDGQRHTPMAALSPEVGARCVTLVAPSKTFNVAGLDCAFAVISNPELRQAYNRAAAGLTPWPNVMGLTAALAAYTQGADWLDELLVYLRANRDALAQFVAERLPGVRTTVPQATYLAWLDFRALDLPGGPYEFMLKEARVALNDGKTFGPGGEGFVRLNFGCPRATLMEALERMAEACQKARD